MINTPLDDNTKIKDNYHTHPKMFIKPYIWDIVMCKIDLFYKVNNPVNKTLHIMNPTCSKFIDMKYSW